MPVNQSGIEVSFKSTRNDLAQAIVTVNCRHHTDERTVIVPLTGDMSFDQMKLFALKSALDQIDEVAGLLRSEISNRETQG
jgi:hypothetical protein